MYIPDDGLADGGEEYTEEELEIINTSCPMCDGQPVYMGALGNLLHFRCQNCGMDFSKESTHE